MLLHYLFRAIVVTTLTIVAMQHTSVHAAMMSPSVHFSASSPNASISSRAGSYWDQMIVIDNRYSSSRMSLATITSNTAGKVNTNSSIKALEYNFSAYTMRQNPLSHFYINYVLDNHVFSFKVDLESGWYSQTLRFNQTTSEQTMTIDGQEYAMHITGLSRTSNASPSTFSITDNSVGNRRGETGYIHMELVAIPPPSLPSAPIPEPAALALFGTGALLLHRRRSA
ncbi:PEP-CTERM sorting domain-containing protein [Poriferisphaera sp. WC338]|uniref:PEP-CTERM sorting domain-containing protein n=1 Tax=Poriferisphaera sp. WC338 TaxID=3425129 RepID=UPI003D818AE9